jgi:hypothetical protein
MPRYVLDDFTMELPEGWTFRLCAMVGPPEAFGRNEPRYKANVVVGCEGLDKPMTAEEFANGQMGELKQDAQGFREIAREKISIDGADALLLEFSFLGPGGMMLRQINGYRPMSNNRMLVLNGSHLIGRRFDDIRALYVDFFKSFKAGA